MLNVGIQLDRATPEAGQLLMIAGSHRGTSRLPGSKETEHLPVTPLSTEPGDVTVHFGHTLHAAPPPTEHQRSRAPGPLPDLRPAVTFEMVAPGQGYNDVLFARTDGHIKHVDQLR